VEVFEQMFECGSGGGDLDPYLHRSPVMAGRTTRREGQQMRRYDDPVEVRRGMVPGPGGQEEGPEQFLWRGRLWKVCDVVAHWVETGPWWQSSGVHAVLGSDEPDASASGAAGSSGSFGTAGGAVALDLAAEREVWRVEAARGLTAAGTGGSGRGVFDLVLDWTDGSWQLTRCAD
jgi:hypothetical protein